MFVQEQYEAAYQVGRRWAESVLDRWTALGHELPLEWPFTREDALAFAGAEDRNEDARPKAAIVHAAAQLRWRQLLRRESGVVKCTSDVDRDAPTAPSVPAARRSARPT
jgi:hypothetical protein